jgi:hypothetical protein
VNHPSVESLRPDRCGGIHATRNLVGQIKKGSVGRGHAIGIAEEELVEGFYGLSLVFRRFGTRDTQGQVSLSSHVLKS